MRDFRKARIAIELFDEKLLELIALRMDEVDVIGLYKVENGLPIKDTTRESQLRHSLVEKGSLLGLDQHFIDELYEVIIKYSCARQDSLKNKILN